jgi:glutathione S-transferase
VIYHIAYRSDWQQAQDDGEYAVSTRGRTLAEEGFIHASTAEQVTPVANMFYRGESDLVLLTIDPDRVAADIRWDLVPGSDQPFPHIYGPLNVDAVIDVQPFRN